MSLLNKNKLASFILLVLFISIFPISFSQENIKEKYNLGEIKEISNNHQWLIPNRTPYKMGDKINPKDRDVIYFEFPINKYTRMIPFDKAVKDEVTFHPYENEFLMSKPLDFIRIRRMLYQSKEEIEAKRDIVRDQWLEEFIPKESEYHYIEKEEWPEFEFVKYTKKWWDLQRHDSFGQTDYESIYFISLKEEHRRADGRNFTFHCGYHPIGRKCSSRVYMPDYRIYFYYTLMVNYLTLKENIDKYIKVEKEIEQMIKKYYRD